MRVSVVVRVGGDGEGIGEESMGLDSRGVGGRDFLAALWYSIMLNIFSGRLLEVMIVVTPAPVAISAAISLVSIPPVPRLEPRVVVLTE